MIEILPKLTRTYILDRITQEDIFAKYLNVDLLIIQQCINTNKLIKSPLRVDNNPTCGFFVKPDGRISFNDFAGYFKGDCFDVVGYHNLLNADNPVDFNKILHIVAKDFKLHQYRNKRNDGLINVTTYNTVKKFKLIDIVKRDWNYADICYWNRFNINTQILNYFRVFPVRTASLNSQDIYYYYDNDPCYAYYLGTDTKGIHWKLYFPYRKEYKFITNSYKVQGTHAVKDSKIGIITKSLKDVMSLFSFGVSAIAVPSEHTHLNLSQYSYLKSKWDNIFSLMDYDYTGIKLANQIKKHNIPALFFTNGNNNTFDFEVKDFSEHVDKWGIQNTLNLLEYIKVEGFYNFNTPDFQDFLNYNYG